MRFGKIARAIAAAAVSLCCALPAAASAAVLTFEDLDRGVHEERPLTTYAGFEWQGATAIVRPWGTTKPIPSPAYGTVGVVSVLGAGGTAVTMRRTDPFSLTGAYITATQYWTENVVVEGWRAGVPVYTQTIMTFSGGPVWFDFDVRDVDTIRFIPAAGQIAIDNVSCALAPDTTLPRISIMRGQEGIVAGPAVSMSIAAWDVAGIASGFVRSGDSVQSFQIAAPAPGFSSWFMVPLPLEGRNDVLVSATDAAGNVATALVEVMRDLQPPTIELVSPRPGAVVGAATFPVTVRVSDVSATRVLVNGVQATASGDLATATVTAPGDGTFRLDVGAFDAQGHFSRAVMDVQVDTSGPAASLDVASGSRFGPLPGNLLPVTVTVQDSSACAVTAPSGASATTPAGGGEVTLAVPLVEGDNALTFNVTDAGGHSTSLPLLVGYDTTPPVARFTAPGDAPVRGTAEVVLSAVDTLSGISSAQAALDGTPLLLAGTGPWSAAVDTVVLTDGPHLLDAVVVDGAQNATTISATLLVDNAPPSVSIDAPAANTWVRGVVTLTASAADPLSGIGDIRLFARGLQIATCTESTTCSAHLDTQAMPDGAFVAAAVARDRAGNERTAQLELLADNGVAAGFLKRPAAGALVGAAVDVEVSVEDPGFASVECIAGQTSLGLSQVPAFTRTLDLRGFVDGPLRIACTARDLAGNEATESVTVTVRNWTLDLDPRVLNLSSSGGANSVTLYVEGENVALLLGTPSLALSVPGGAPVPATEHPAGTAPGDRDHDGIPDLALKFDRAALVAAIRGARAAGVLAGDRVPVSLLGGEYTLGVTAIDVR